MSNKNRTFAAFALALAAALPTIASATYYTTSNTLLPGMYRDYRISFSRGNHTINLRGDGSSDLDLYVYGANGLSVKDDSTSDGAQVVLNVTRAGYFTIRVYNAGNTADYYHLEG